MDENISGFFGPEPGYGQPDLRSFTPIPTSKAASCELYRGERAGRFRVYKCLKPQFRGDLLHEGILKKEFEAGYSLRHPNVCEIYSYMEIEGLGNCIEMEWIDGITLDDYLAGMALDEDSFRKLAGELCDAVSYLHSHQILHRDIKPSNILITHQGHFAKIIDFSLADSDAHVLLKQAAGTRSFAAPEVLAGKEASQSSDLYSLAKVFSRMTKSHRRVLERCTSADPSSRYADAASLEAALLKKKSGWIWILAMVMLAIVGGIFRTGTHQKPQAEASLPSRDSTAGPVARDTVFIEVPKEAPRQIQPKEDAVQDADIDAIFQQATELFD